MTTVQAQRWPRCRLRGDHGAGSEVTTVQAQRWPRCRLRGDHGAGSEMTTVQAQIWPQRRLRDDYGAGSEMTTVQAQRWPRCRLKDDRGARSEMTTVVSRSYRAPLLETLIFRTIRCGMHIERSHMCSDTCDAAITTSSAMCWVVKQPWLSHQIAVLCCRVRLDEIMFIF